jgi:hypothetical protein
MPKSPSRPARNADQSRKTSDFAPLKAKDPNFDIGAALRSLEAPTPAEQPSSPRTLRLQLTAAVGETSESVLARTALQPTLRAAQAIASFDESVGELDLTALIGKLADQVNAVHAGDLGRAEEMLIAQAHTLDMIFSRLLIRSMTNMQAGCSETGEMYMKLALRSQSQCRATLETLAVVKNPPAVAFVKQANIANGPQQVNNGHGPTTAGPGARAGKSLNLQSRVLEQQNGERLDPGASQASVGAHSPLEAMGALNGSADA